MRPAVMKLILLLKRTVIIVVNGICSISHCHSLFLMCIMTMITMELCSNVRLVLGFHGVSRPSRGDARRFTIANVILQYANEVFFSLEVTFQKFKKC